MDGGSPSELAPTEKRATVRTALYYTDDKKQSGASGRSTVFGFLDIINISGGIRRPCRRCGPECFQRRSWYKKEARRKD